MRFLPLLALPLLSCVVDRQWEDLDLREIPFENEHTVVLGGIPASMRVLTLPGYDCPDGRAARLHVVRRTDADAVAPIALLLHGRNFDWINGAEEHVDGTDKLSGPWSTFAVEDLLGVAEPTTAGAPPQGAWAAGLLEAGWALAVPGNCWGDLWHGRGVNDWGDEGFLRLGAWFLQDAIAAAHAEPGVSSDRLVVVGLSEGGRGIVELGLEGVAMDAAVIDSSLDWLSPLLGQPAVNAEYIAGLERIFDDALGDVTDVGERRDLLRDELQRHSLVHLVEQEGWRVPIIYAYSELDDRVDPALSRPASIAISSSYGGVPHRVLDWQSASHAPSNQVLDQVREQVAWLTDVLGPTPVLQD